MTGDSPEIIKEQEREAKPEMAGEKVWLIDDDQTLFEMTTAILNSAGMEVHPFSDPKKAKNSFEKDCADLLITDIQMPVMNGVEVLKHIEKKNGGQIKSIAISGSDTGKIEFAGFSTFIQKPYKPQTLIDAISGQLIGKAVSVNRDVVESSRKTGYNLKQLESFAEGDPEVLRLILESFISTGKQNAVLLKQYLQEENYNAISELSHKMLPLFRQLEAYDITELLTQLEQKDFARMYSIKYYSQGKSVLEMIDTLLSTIQNEENIHVN